MSAPRGVRGSEIIGSGFRNRIECNYDGHFRKIEAKIARPKIMVQTRRGYYALPELNGEPLQPLEVIALKAINARPAPVEFPYPVAAMEFRPKENAVDYEVAFEVPTSGLTVVAHPRTGRVAFGPRHPWRDGQQGRP